MTARAEKPARKRSTFRLSPEVHQWLRDYAHYHNVSQNDVVDSAIRELLTPYSDRNMNV